jgi:hypothetical protein
MTLQQAIARQEGFGKPGTLATVNHNPGNIIAGAWATAHGAVKENDGFAVFPDDATGWRALTALLSGPEYRELTVEQAIEKYCPVPKFGNEALAEGNLPSIYVLHVAAWLGVSPLTPIAGLLTERA